MEFTGRFSMLGATARAEPGDVGYQSGQADTLAADQQGLRLMLDNAAERHEWSVHLRSIRQHLSGIPYNDIHSSDLFRYHSGAGRSFFDTDGDSTTSIDYELDRAVYRHRFKDMTLSLGRQPIDWGVGRFWQPMNVFGAFAPTDLDTDYKAGIDTITLEAYPGPFSAITAVYALAPHDESELSNSGALHYRRAVGETSEVTVVGGRITGNKVLGASFESAWEGLGWRVEGLTYRLEGEAERELFWIAGIEYQFENQILLHAEYYDNSRGASAEFELATLSGDPLIATGLQQQLSRQMLGIGLNKDLTPLLNAGYTLLAAKLKDAGGQGHVSLLHQLNLVYSVSNESDLLASLLFASGKGLSATDAPQSEFGHLPNSLSLRLRFYF